MSAALTVTSHGKKIMTHKKYLLSTWLSLSRKKITQYMPRHYVAADTFMSSAKQHITYCFSSLSLVLWYVVNGGTSMNGLYIYITTLQCA